MNLIAEQQFQLTYKDIAVQYICYYSTGDTLLCIYILSSLIKIVFLNVIIWNQFNSELNKSWRQHTPTKQQLYGHPPPITKTIQLRRTRHAGHCRRNRDELVSDVLQWTPENGRAKAGRPARTYIQQICEDRKCSPDDLPEAMNDREEWREGSRISVLVARQDDDDDDTYKLNS